MVTMMMMMMTMMMMKMMMNVLILPTAGQVKFSHLNLAPVNMPLHESVMLVAILEDMLLGGKSRDMLTNTVKQTSMHIYIYCFFVFLT